jgi:phosphatidylglycerol:prolipoprotein diacylglycerol transferase
MGHRYTRFDAVTPLHPSPVYELLLGVLGFGILLLLRSRLTTDGTLFMVYLLLSALFRFLAEEVRLNPRIFLGLTEAQLFSVALFVLGCAGLLILTRRQRTARAPST